MFIGLDIGGTFLKGARVDDRGTVQDRLHQPVRQDSVTAFLGQIAEAVRNLEGPAGSRGVGIGLPGIVDRALGGVHVSPNLPILDGLAVANETARATGRPTFVENDANAAALAEHWLGAGRGADDLLYVTLGTGVGAALILGGKLWLGRSGYAGELGHLQVDAQGPPCGCGSWGCLEGVAGAPGWHRRAEAALRSRASSLRGTALDPATIVEAARHGDAVALEVVEDAARAIAVGIAAVLQLLNLRRVVLGGGVAAAGAFLLDRIATEVARRTYAQVFADCELRTAALEGDAGAIGAARVAMTALSAPSP